MATACKFPITRKLLDEIVRAGGGANFVVFQMCKRLGWTREGGWVDNGRGTISFWEVDGPTLEAMVHDFLWCRLCQDVSRRKHMAYLADSVIPLPWAIKAVREVPLELRPFAVGVLAGAYR